MSQTANYAATPVFGAATTITADTSYSAPTLATEGIVYTAPAEGARIDNISGVSQGTSTAGLARLWVAEGCAGRGVLSISSSGTTATMTTTDSHGLVTGDLVTLQKVFPIGFNVKDAPVTVISGTIFSFPIPNLSNVPALTVGSYSASPAVPVQSLLAEIPIVAIIGSGTNRAFRFSFDSQRDTDFLPLLLPPGHSLRVTVSVSQTHALRVVARGGSF